MLKREVLSQEIKNKLKQYGIEERDYRLKMQKYRSEDKAGVPYRALIIKKSLTDAKQFELEMELKDIDSSLCVIFKNPSHGRILHLK